jgi:acetolactate synthase-1/2/3 large subunit
MGVALVTTGPGGTNAITGVAASWIDSIPCLILSGQVKRTDLIKDSRLRQKGVQEVDIISLIKPITKYAVTIMDPESIRYHLEKAVHLAKSGRPGPVWIDIPLDVQAAIIDPKKLHIFVSDEKKSIPPAKEVAQLISLLAMSKKPVILAGNGIRLANAEEDFLRLIERLQIPVLTTWKAVDILQDNHPFYFGRPGSIGQRGANFIQQTSDLFIAIGARLDLAQVGFSYPSFAPKAKKAIVDIDPFEINKLGFSGLNINSDAKLFISEMMDQTKHMNKPDHSKWLAHCRYLVSEYPVILPEHKTQTKYVSTYALVDVLSDLLTGNDVIVPGSSGACSEIILQSFRVKRGQRIINSPGLGAMGFGLPDAIGACIASKRRTICINGDGGFQLNIQELETVARLKLPIKFFILNNDGYGSIKNTQRNYFQGRFVCSGASSGLTIPNMVKVATAYGIHSFKITSNSTLKESVLKALNFDGPVLCDVMVDPAEPTMPRLKSEIRPDGTMVSKTLEDLWPFLDPEVVKSELSYTP